MNTDRFHLEHREKANPFRVPEGYFANLQKEVMERIPQQPRKHRSRQQRARLVRLACYSAAASLCFAIFGAAYVHFSSADDQKVAGIEKTQTADEACFASDYIMLDNDALYSYISEY